MNMTVQLKGTSHPKQLAILSKPGPELEKEQALATVIQVNQKLCAGYGI
jgi:hypothetical protein